MLTPRVSKEWPSKYVFSLWHPDIELRNSSCRKIDLNLIQTFGLVLYFGSVRRRQIARRGAKKHTYHALPCVCSVTGSVF